MLNICAKFNENRTRSFREITASVTNQQHRMITCFPQFLLVQLKYFCIKCIGDKLYIGADCVCHVAGLGDVARSSLFTKAEKKKKKSVTSETTSLPVAESPASQPIRVLLRFKRNIFDPRKQMLQ